MTTQTRATLPHGPAKTPDNTPTSRISAATAAYERNAVFEDMHAVERAIIARHGAATRAMQRMFRGQVYRPGDDGYDEARLPWRRSSDPLPLIVAEATGPDDVRAAILTARDHDLPLAVQSTGHGTFRSSDGGLLLKTSRMAGVEIDPERRTARVGAGALWKDVIAASAPFGLAPLSGSSAWVGVAGYTLGGGAGWLSRKYGFASDSLISAEVVTASGDMLRASAEENPDLFWALRGGGGSFGIVTSLEFRLYPVAQVYAGMSVFDAGRAAKSLAYYREWATVQPDDLEASIILMRMPDAPQVTEAVRGKRVLALRAFYAGAEDEAEKLLAPLRGVMGEPLMEGLRATTFAEFSAGPPPAPLVSRDHVDLFRQVPDAVIETLVEAAGEGADAPLTAVELRHWGGAMARPEPGAGPTGHRDVPFSVMATAKIDGARGPEEVEAYMAGLAARLRRYATGGSFLNFLTDPTRTETAFTAENFRRLAEVKKTYDPDNFFRLNHNIRPVAAGDAERVSYQEDAVHQLRGR